MSPRAALRRTVCALALCLAACLYDGTGTGAGNTITDNGGTGTSAGNTVTARVLTLDGSPAAGAAVYLRPEGFVPDSVVPGIDSLSGKVAKGLTDAQGRVSLSADTGRGYVLEVSRGSGEGRQVAWREAVRLTAWGARADLGDVPLSQAATLTGNLSGSAGPSGIWIGVQGTSAFVRTGADGGFTLTGLPPGARDLAVFRHLLFNRWQKFLVRGWRVSAGTHFVLDSLELPVAVSGNGNEPDAIVTDEKALTASACLEKAGTLTLDAYPGPARSGKEHVVRAWMNAPMPGWVELDPCLGTWRRVADLPPDTGFGLGSFSFESYDFVALPSSKEYRVLDTTGAEVLSYPVPASVREIEYYEGMFYAVPNGTGKVKAYASLNAIDSGKAADSLELHVPAGKWDMAIEDSIVYLAQVGAGVPTLERFDLRARSTMPPVSLPDQGGPLMGMAGAGGGRLWILHAVNRLELYRMPGPDQMNTQPALLQSLGADGPGALSGLVRFRSSGKSVDLPSAVPKQAPSDSSHPLLDSAGCVAGDTLSEFPYRVPPKPGDVRVLRSYMEGTTSPEWIEIDPCQGAWRTISPIGMDGTKAMGTFSTEREDYFVSLNRGLAMRFDSAGVYQGTRPLPSRLVEAEYADGKYYAIYENDAWLHMMGDSASFWAGSGNVRIPGLQFPSASTWDIAVVGDIVYWAASETFNNGTPKDTVTVFRYSLANNAVLPSFRIGGFHGAPAGISSGADGRLWLLDAANRLFRVDVHAATAAAPNGWKLEAVLSVKLRNAGGKLYGLTRFRESAASVPYKAPVVP